jgi:SAM-dependent methyltransferase
MIDPAWEGHAEWWQREFTDGADPEYTEQILPLAEEWLAGFERVLDIGTGDGQVARRIHAGHAGHAGHGGLVVGLDGARNQVVEARRRGPDVSYLQGEALGLPFAASSFDAVVACLVFEHLDDLEGSIQEVARVLRPGGRFVLMLNHPLLQTPGSGWIDDQILDPPEQYWRVGAYLEEGSVVEQVTPGVFIRFVHRPFSRYLNTMVGCGLELERMLEPAPPPGFLARAPEYTEAASIPRLAVLVARRSQPAP